MNRLHEWYCASGYWRRRAHQTILPWATAGMPLGDARVPELGPGPGVTTDWLLSRCGRLTALERDDFATERLARRFGAAIDVHNGDATSMPFADGAFDVVVCFTMLHHIPSPAAQDGHFQEVVRVLRAGGTFAGSDSISGPLFVVAHFGDTLTAIRPRDLPGRLLDAGLQDVSVDARRGAFRWRGTTPA
ncbi:MAG: class I SAM-dependent methyltransferase [Candidatus Dormibacteraeota bacterium]|uniref:Class I SAM-dependent methyltransferase n=1 Tax=Candidatus Aeolococcus gillhamiae TaxID=3127015 RepID=A0A934N5Y7_9BACT|nr:class I SAM-dependent methyltransferase [Candidatus Dormibacteraeota bacterium]